MTCLHPETTCNDCGMGFTAMSEPIHAAPPADPEAQQTTTADDDAWLTGKTQTRRTPTPPADPEALARLESEIARWHRADEADVQGVTLAQHIARTVGVAPATDGRTDG